ncbi:MAG: peptidoglycan DD-metalloendopeptidase family protein [Candidatus Aminicenantes bacterium]|nr:peptidoglycan DD-metalloendopeptidase family protein [Candidatus Aminicenantes bacterium]NIM80707.1 peptidoglycan DD-metalloendopeptidase family protein [Candidatus Aminicenantes bacterium]NIN20082.1 peptidoglycan DD-metalloendopeptidase family protein [Candidatus Aminicenantes bacterium]NIN43869.1 peptidoglycan DD-metalloendopeptidase family protein [Candidatus Aminicenantes bacterium]NIN86678.1 peptidoglycan DD-metalloendopeptidase family protein [Candidatus Aminicenantes bacterium]
MKTLIPGAIILFLFVVAVPGDTRYSIADHIQEDKERWKPFYINVTPSQTVNQWKVPFKTENRNRLNTVRVLSTFGAKRLSYVRGHFHTGIDLIPANSREQFIYVYPMAEGVVCSIHLGDPHKTVVIKHKLSSGKVIYTSYKHLQKILVTNGLQVTTDTRLGRLYTADEARALGGNYNHLHLETRKKFDDYGVASWATLTRADLDRRFYDPWKFMKENIR